jgi:hypothetical protein
LRFFEDVADAVSELGPLGHREGFGRGEVRVSGRGEEVFGIVIWAQAVGEGGLVTSLFLGGDELAMREPDEGVKPKGGSDDGGKDADERVAPLKVGGFVEEGGIEPTEWPGGAIVGKEDARSDESAGKRSGGRWGEGKRGCFATRLVDLFPKREGRIEGF